MTIYCIVGDGSMLVAMLPQKYLFELRDGILPEPKVSMSIKPKDGMWMRVARRKA